MNPTANYCRSTTPDWADLIARIVLDCIAPKRAGHTFLEMNGSHIANPVQFCLGKGFLSTLATKLLATQAVTTSHRDLPGHCPVVESFFLHHLSCLVQESGEGFEHYISQSPNSGNFIPRFHVPKLHRSPTELLLLHLHRQGKPF